MRQAGWFGLRNDAPKQPNQLQALCEDTSSRCSLSQSSCRIERASIFPICDTILATRCDRLHCKNSVANLPSSTRMVLLFSKQTERAPLSKRSFRSQPCLAVGRLFIQLELGAAVGNEAVAIRHRHLRQGLRVHHLGRLDDLAFREDVSDHAVDLIVGQRARRTEWHRSLDVIEQRRGIGPVAFDSLDRRFARERTTTAEQLIATDSLRRIALQLVAVTGGAVLGKDGCSGYRVAAAGR